MGGTSEVGVRGAGSGVPLASPEAPEPPRRGARQKFGRARGAGRGARGLRGGARARGRSLALSLSLSLLRALRAPPAPMAPLLPAAGAGRAGGAGLAAAPKEGGGGADVDCRVPEAQGLASALARLPSLAADPPAAGPRRAEWMAAAAGEAVVALSEWLASAPRLPAHFVRPLEGSCCYARRLLCACPRGRFQAIAMTWGPGQSAPVHDHAGLWCVEGLYCGRLLTQDWEPPSPAGPSGDGREELFRFPPPGAWAEQGRETVETIVPPQEFHILANPFEEAAVTIHIYGGPMNSCRTFHPAEEGAGERGGLHRLKTCELRFTPEEEPEEGSCAGGETRRGASFSGGASGGRPLTPLMAPPL